MINAPFTWPFSPPLATLPFRVYDIDPLSLGLSTGDVAIGGVIGDG